MPTGCLELRHASPCDPTASALCDFMKGKQMTDITSPRHPLTADRLTECEEAVETALQDLVWRAVKAGWDEVEVCTAIATLADHHILAVIENHKTARALKHTRKMRRRNH